VRTGPARRASHSDAYMHLAESIRAWPD